MSAWAAVSWLGPEAPWGQGLLRALQSVHSPLLDRFFIAFTMLGSEEFFVLVLPVLYWCVDRELGRRLTRLFLFSTFLNLWLKDTFQSLRPAADQARIRFSQSATGYSFPSGHAQGAAAFWGYLAFQVRRRWFTALAATMVLSVAYSRLYLGVHWPVDVTAGILIGLLVAGVWAKAGQWWDGEFAAIAGALRVPGAFLLPLLLLALDRSTEAVKAVGVLAGFSGGTALAKEVIRWPKHEGWVRQMAKASFGLTGLILLRSGLKVVFPPGPIFDGLRYGVVGFWGGFALPWLFGWLWPADGGR